MEEAQPSKGTMLFVLVWPLEYISSNNLTLKRNPPSLHMFEFAPSEQNAYHCLHCQHVSFSHQNLGSYIFAHSFSDTEYFVYPTTLLVSSMTPALPRLSPDVIGVIFHSLYCTFTLRCSWWQLILMKNVFYVYNSSQPYQQLLSIYLSICNMYNMPINIYLSIICIIFL